MKHCGDMSDVRPEQVVRWVNDEVARIEAAFGEVLNAKAAHAGDALLTLEDPGGRGWTATARLVEVRSGEQGLEFAVFLDAHPPYRRRPTVHLWGVDARDDGQRVSVAADSPWREIAPHHGPALEAGIDRLIRGNFRPPLRRRRAEPYGGL